MSTSIVVSELINPLSSSRIAISSAYCRDESDSVHELLNLATLDQIERDQVLARATDLVERVRAKTPQQSLVESFMREYDLSSEEGVLLMCVAEALLRIPDKDTADKLIQDKLGDANWESHLGKSGSVLVNASTWGLMLTGKLVTLGEETQRSFTGALKRLIGRAGEPVIRLAVRRAMRIMGHQFVMGRTIEEALSRSQEKENKFYRYSYDMLGEAALTGPDAERYHQAYKMAIVAIGKRGPYSSIIDAPSISVKLSALHPRYEVAKRARVLEELTPKLLELAQLAKTQGIGMTVDAEEADRLELSLDVIGTVFAHPSLEGWNGFGLAVQAYQKRCMFVIDWLAEQADKTRRRWCVRLVKGAYWDSEIKRAQEAGHCDYPVFTRKPNTDVSYLACARRLFSYGDRFYPQFATHNAQTISAIYHYSQGKPFEFQRLHGMGADLYEEVIGEKNLKNQPKNSHERESVEGGRSAGTAVYTEVHEDSEHRPTSNHTRAVSSWAGSNVPCRVYAPVGTHEDLLPYLVRRLLENGANTSFVNRISDATTPAQELVADPCEIVRKFDSIPHPRIPSPLHLYGESRKNSMGINLANDNELKALSDAINAAIKPWRAAPLVPGTTNVTPPIQVTDPADRRRIVGEWQAADSATVAKALENAVSAQSEWDGMFATSRAKILEQAADLLEANRGELIALCVREAGKTLPDGIAEVREAVDFCRYYAAQARKLFAQPETLPGPTGESNQLFLHGRGVFVCISPWNFPLAIFIGQITAALVSGNAVIAKPAEQTNLIAYRATQLLHEAGIPEAVLQLLPGDGATVGAALCNDPRVSGVAFTGSTETARAINRSLAARDAAIGTLIAETGGQNALIADSSALPEQLVKDVIVSSFGSAGQRCSCLRVLFVQEDIADKVITMLAGAMDELVVGDPGLLSTDVGPVIDNDARMNLEKHAARMDKEAKLIKALPLDESTQHGTFVAPRAYEITSLQQLEKEEFGPILHVIRYKASELDSVIDAINATGYGLTLGIHSRIDSTIQKISTRIKTGNCYVNRNMVGAVVGVQPFGGEGLSGTGPKAGGPHYLLRFATERTLTINTTAAGGNASLLTLGS